MAERTLIAYCSWSGNTEKIAKLIQQEIGGDLWKIEPEDAYSAHYTTVVKQAKKEIQKGYAPGLVSLPDSIDAYEHIFIGSPNWCNTMAPPLLTFCRAFDFSDKRVIPFCTHGGGGEARVLNDITQACRKGEGMKGISFYDDGGKRARSSLVSWLEMLSIPS